MGKKRRVADILCVVAVALGVMVFALIVDGLAFLGMKYVFHLDFSQEYRQGYLSSGFGRAGMKRFT